MFHELHQVELFSCCGHAQCYAAHNVSTPGMQNSRSMHEVLI